ncbi:MAG: hypothetical protein OQK76_00010 [Gammaproteobacteria bacterium]|nr:hypothetical protein [Gammaproteobacteria bacterium]MCW8908979.1 hypothetical protein [Gammaproteobacteria bacterium]MCW9006005.1 hypothetical protein [Gammaproteobacteria bacterium]MCW9055645.1 hypothetical protein [Gammaproteobacteria bacterium]
MTNRMYRGMLGALLLVSLYFDLSMVMYGIIIVLFFEGITNLIIPKLVDLSGRIIVPGNSLFVYKPEPCGVGSRFGFESERAWRLVVGFMLLVTFYYYDVLWFFPWFMGFAIFGAGLSGVCPVLLAIRWAGFK